MEEYLSFRSSAGKCFSSSHFMTDQETCLSLSTSGKKTRVSFSWYVLCSALGLCFRPYSSIIGNPAFSASGLEECSWLWWPWWPRSSWPSLAWPWDPLKIVVWRVRFQISWASRSFVSHVCWNGDRVQFPESEKYFSGRRRPLNQIFDGLITSSLPRQSWREHVSS